MKDLFINFFKYIKSVLVHKFWVCYYCFISGIYWRGIVHDISKFSFTEMSEGIKYFKDNQCSAELCRKDKGYSLAKLHHKGRNKYCPEYWMDTYDGKEIIVPMPYKYIVEFLCDILGKARQYNDKDGSFSYKSLYSWWNDWSMCNIKMNDSGKDMITHVLNYLAMGFKPIVILNRKFLKRLYNKSKERYVN